MRPSALCLTPLALLVVVAAPRTERVVLTWPGDPRTSVAVNWRSSERLTSPKVRFETVGAQPVDVAAQEQIVRLPNRSAYHYTAVARTLKPATRWTYRIGDAPTGSFTTAGTGPFEFLYFGDVQNDIRAKWTSIARAAYRAAPNARFAIYAGDLVNGGDSDTEWGQWFEAGAAMLANVPTVATPGNHEYSPGRLSRQWRPQFEYPTHGPSGLEETCYFVDFQGVRIVSLDSNRKLAEQAAWLDRVLALDPQRWAIVTFHHPIFSGAIRRDNPEHRRHWTPVFDRHGVDLVLQGHDHVYTRSGRVRAGKPVANDAPGTVYVVSVSGPKMYDLNSQFLVPMRKTAHRTQLFQVLSVADDRIGYEARTEDGRVIDKFTLRRTESGKRIED